MYDTHTDVNTQKHMEHSSKRNVMKELILYLVDDTTYIPLHVAKVFCT